MEHRASILWIVLLSLLGRALTYQEKASLQPSQGQARGENLQQTQQQVLGGRGSGSGSVGVDTDTVGSTRNIEDHLLTSMGKAGFKHFVGSSSTTTAKPPVQHQHHYYYTSEGSEHPRQHGPVLPPGVYPWPGYPQVPPQRPWAPPYNPWPYGWGHWGGGGGGGGYPWYRSTENEELDENAVQPELAPRSIPGSYQARVLASTSNLVAGKSNNNVWPLYHLLNVARV
ncbi:uncharacterized protein LOC115769506 [Drosophila novamexicana]|uniref:uncharacterized protein LOC115769506 n=1 Tax=Drosophila novamexicana TaxID=47314 RepID=UPI0011E59F92|nr:uncharacterized protein LOC115769506 [Drosophila novamexicana]